MKVVTAGAGLGGLCLAHGLRQAGLDVQVVERRPPPADQPTSYGIHLNPHGLRALRACLPSANWDQLMDSSVRALDVVRFRDQQLRALAVIDHEDLAADPALHRRAVGRTALRDALLLGLNTTTSNATDVVQWGRAVTRYEHNPDSDPPTCGSGPTAATHSSGPGGCRGWTGESSASSTSRAGSRSPPTCTPACPRP